MLYITSLCIRLLLSEFKKPIILFILKYNCVTLPAQSARTKGIEEKCASSIVVLLTTYFLFFTEIKIIIKKLKITRDSDILVTIFVNILTTFDISYRKDYICFDFRLTYTHICIYLQYIKQSACEIDYCYHKSIIFVQDLQLLLTVLLDYVLNRNDIQFTMF